MVLVYYISLGHMNTLDRLITRPFDETLRYLLPSYLDPIQDDSISSASSFWVSSLRFESMKNFRFPAEIRIADLPI